MRKDSMLIVDIEKPRSMVMECIKSIVFVLCFHMVSVLILTQTHSDQELWACLVLLGAIVTPLYFVVKGNTKRPWLYILMVCVAHAVCACITLAYLKGQHHDSDVAMYCMILCLFIVTILYDVVGTSVHAYKKGGSLTPKTHSFMVDTAKSVGYTFGIHLICVLICAFIIENKWLETKAIGLFIILYAICAPLYFVVKGNTKRPWTYILITCMSHVLFGFVILSVAGLYYGENSLDPFSYMAGLYITLYFMIGVAVFDVIYTGVQACRKHILK